MRTSEINLILSEKWSFAISEKEANFQFVKVIKICDGSKAFCIFRDWRNLYSASRWGGGHGDDAKNLFYNGSFTLRQIKFYCGNEAYSERHRDYLLGTHIDFFPSVDITERKNYRSIPFEYNPETVCPLMCLTIDYPSQFLTLRGH